MGGYRLPASRSETNRIFSASKGQIIVMLFIWLLLGSLSTRPGRLPCKVGEC